LDNEQELQILQFAIQSIAAIAASVIFYFKFFILKRAKSSAIAHLTIATISKSNYKVKKILNYLLKLLLKIDDRSSIIQIS